MAHFTPTQGRYLAYIHAYTNLHGIPPAETDIGRAMCVSPPSVNQMVKSLEKRGLILRQPGQPRTIRVLVPEEEIPLWNNRRTSPPVAGSFGRPPVGPVPASPPGTLFVLKVFLKQGPVSGKFANREISRVIEIRGDQTLADLHVAISQAFDRPEDRDYDFHLGKRSFDPDAPNFGIPDKAWPQLKVQDARAVKLDDLDLKLERVFGYRFDFDINWFHWVQIDRIEKAIPTVTYPRVARRVGPSPPQFAGR